MAFPHDGKKFKKGNNANPKGRPKKRLVSVINEELKVEGYDRVSKSQVQEAFEVMIQLPVDKLKDIASNKTNYPILYSLIAKELLSRNGAITLERILDRTHGRPNQSVDHGVQEGHSIEFKVLKDVKDSLDKLD